MGWYDIGGNYLVSRSNLYEAAYLYGIFTAKNSIPSDGYCVNCSDADYYVYINSIPKGSSTMAIKDDLVSSGGGGFTCFAAGTMVIRENGTKVAIETIQIGDRLLGKDGTINTVLGHDNPILGHRVLFSFNNGAFFVTVEHPFMTTEGWKSLGPTATKRENPNLNIDIARLQIGDTLVMADGKTEKLEKLDHIHAGYFTQLYNFKLDGDNTYYANDYLVHNKNPVV